MMAMSSSSRNQITKLADIHILILMDDIQQKDLEGPSSSALITKGRGRTQERSQGGDKGKSREKSKSKSNGAKCWHCGERQGIGKNIADLQRVKGTRQINLLMLRQKCKMRS